MKKIFINILGSIIKVIVIGYVLSFSPVKVFGDESRYYQLVDSADMKLKLSQWGLAEEYLLKALREDPANSGNTLLFSNLGVAQMEQHKFDDAIVSFRLALTRASKSTVIRTHLAKALLALGNLEGGEGELSRILEIDQKNEWALQTRGLIRLRKIIPKVMEKVENNEVEETDGGEERFNDFRSLAIEYPENPWGWYGLGVEAEERSIISSDSKQERNESLSKAEEYYNKSYSLGESPEISFRLAMLLLREDRISEAMKLLRESMRKHPRDGNLYAAMGWAHKKMYQYEEASADLKLAREYGGTPEIIRWIEKGD